MSNQILGVHVIGGKYKFSDLHHDVDGAKELSKLGSKIIKINFTDINLFDEIASMDFDYIFLWYKNPKLNDCINHEVVKKEMEYIVNHIYSKYGNTSKSFFIGHWEGDWLLNPPINQYNSCEKIKADRFIEYLNIRQDVLDEIKKKNTDKSVKIFHYTELNRTIDYLDNSLDRFVNMVLPYVNTDFVSYSAYDIQNLSEERIHEVLSFMESKMQKKEIEGYPKRIFIGEFGAPAIMFNFDELLHKKYNMNIIKKFLSYGVPFIIYWELYNNEIEENGTHRGFWLIDDKGKKVELYDFYKKYYLETKNMSFENKLNYVNREDL